MKVVVSAGGTGGHIYPALAIINKIKENESDSEFVYIGTHNRMEKDIVPKENIPYEAIEVYGFNRSNILANVKTVYSFFKSKKKVKNILKEFKPDVVIGIGGYVTGPVISTASKLGYKTFVHEQNSVPGKANLFLKKYATKIGVSFKETLSFFPSEKTIFTGNPRSEAAINSKPYKKKEFGLTNDKKFILFVMGSLGASKVNEVLTEVMNTFENEDFEALFVTGNKDFPVISKQKFPNNIFLVPYVDDLTRIMKKADLIVTRAGASTLSEVAALNLPSIIIPSPYVPNNHQYKNAKPMHDSKAAFLLEEKDLTSKNLSSKIKELIYDDVTLNLYRENMKNYAVTDSATKIYRILKEMVNENE